MTEMFLLMVIIVGVFTCPFLAYRITFETDERKKRKYRRMYAVAVVFFLAAWLLLMRSV